MKYAFLAQAVILLLLSCQPSGEHPAYAAIEGVVHNYKGDILYLINERSDTLKKFKVGPDGSFNDTLIVMPGLAAFRDPAEALTVLIFLKNGDDLSIEFDAAHADASLKVSGKGSQNTSYLIDRYAMQNKVFNEVHDLYQLPKQEYLQQIGEMRNGFVELTTKYNDLDSTLVANDKKGTQQLFGYFESSYDQIADIYTLQGTKSPEFEGYENYAGGTSSLMDFAGKIVLIDVWATWCGPCLREIPHLKELEETFSGQDVAFVSISVDRDNAHDKWRQMIAEMNLGGVQLFANNTFESDFIRAYKINNIPRFILLDKEGMIVDPYAQRPSNPALEKRIAGMLDNNG